MTVKRPSCKLKPGDIIIAVSVAALALLSGVMINTYPRGSSASVTVRTTDGTARYSLSADAEFTISSNGHTLTLAVRDGEAYVASADCPDQVCVNTPAISKGGDAIICVPSRFIASIEAEGDGECDYVAG